MYVHWAAPLFLTNNKFEPTNCLTRQASADVQAYEHEIWKVTIKLSLNLTFNMISTWMYLQSHTLSALSLLPLQELEDHTLIPSALHSLLVKPLMEVGPQPRDDLTGSCPIQYDYLLLYVFSKQG